MVLDEINDVMLCYVKYHGENLKISHGVIHFNLIDAYHLVYTNKVVSAVNFSNILEYTE